MQSTGSIPEVVKLLAPPFQEKLRHCSQTGDQPSTVQLIVRYMIIEMLFTGSVLAQGILLY